MKKLSRTIFFLISALAIGVGNFVYASGLVPCGGAGESACNSCFLMQTFQNIYRLVVVDLTPPIATLLFVYGGFVFLTSGGSEDRVKKAKNIFVATVIGVLIVYASWIIINTIMMLIAKSIPGSGFNPASWWQITC